MVGFEKTIKETEKRNCFCSGCDHLYTLNVEVGASMCPVFYCDDCG